MVLRPALVFLALATSLALSSCPNDAGGDSQDGPEGQSTLPTAPGILTISPESSSILLTWATVPNATHYALVWTDDGGDPTSASPRIDDIVGTLYRHDGLDYKKTYTYRLCASNDAGDSPLSAPATATPLAPSIQTPTGLAIQFSGLDAVIDWDNLPIEGVKYDLYRRASFESTSKLLAYDLSDSGYTDTTLVRGVRYHYRVKARLPAEGRESEFSSEQSCYTVAFLTETERNNPSTWAYMGIEGGFANDATGLDEFYLSGSYSGTYSVFHPGIGKNVDSDLFKITLNRNDTLSFALNYGTMTGLAGKVMHAKIVEVYKEESGTLSELAVRSIYTPTDSFVYSPWSSRMEYVYIAIHSPVDLNGPIGYDYQVKISITRD